jgi:hypothetical protein
VAAGITRLEMDVRHANASLSNLEMRIGIANGAFGPNGSGDTYVTSASMAVPNDGAWHHIAFDLRPPAFTPHSENTNPAPDAAAALANVTQLRILHNPTPDFRGALGGAQFYLDNIHAVPEPAGAVLAACTIAAAGAMRRRRD